MSIWDNIFGTKPVELKLSAPAMSSARISMPKAEPLDFSLDGIKRYSRKSEIVYACIEKKAQMACDPVLVVEKKNSKGEWEPIDGHPLVSLLNKPNPYDDGDSFRKAWITSENYADVFYAEIVRSGAGVPVALYPLDATQMMPDYRETPTGSVLWRYVYMNNGYPIYYLPEELLIRRRHPLGTLYSGVSPAAVALGTVDADSALTDYVRAFFNNGGNPSGILAIKGKRLSQEEAEALQQKWVHRYGRGGTMRGGPAILDEAAEWQQTGSGLDDLDSDVITQKNESRICMVFGVPPVIIGSYTGLKNVNQKASFKGAMEEFWENTMSPELKGIRVFLTWFFLPQFEGGDDEIRKGNLRVNWDMSQVAAMQEDIDAIHDRVSLGYKSGIYKLNEARTAVKLEPIDGEEGEAFYQAPQQLNAMPDDNADEVPPPKQLTDGKAESCPSCGQMSYFAKFGYCAAERKTVTADVLDADTLEKKSIYRREPTEIEQTIDIKAIFDAYENGKDALTKEILAIRKELIRQAAKTASKYTDANLHGITLQAPAGAYKKIEKQIKYAVDDGRGQVAHQALLLNKHHGKHEYKGIVEDLIRKLAELTLSRIIGEVATATANIIASLGVLGYSRDEIEDELIQQLDERSEKPFENYARQAVNKAVNEGRAEEMRAREDDIEYYVWSAILDANVCDPCEELDGSEAERLDQLPDAPYENCAGGANCRCFVVAVFKGEGQPA